MSASRRVQGLDRVDATPVGQLEAVQLDPLLWPEPTFDELVFGYGRHRHGLSRWFRRPASRARRASPTRGAAR